MLCPEVWNFKAPESISTTLKTTSPKAATNTINNLTFNHLVSAVLPDTLKVPEYLTEALNIDCDYYKITKLSLSELVTKQFLSAFVKRGSLYILSIDSRIDCDNCVAVTPKGQLILNLNKTTYQSLGLEGEVSHFHKKSQDRHIITINLTLDCLTVGKPKYEKIVKALTRIGRFNVIVTWNCRDENICPSSIAKYFCNLGYEVKLCKPQYDICTHYSLQVPDCTQVDPDDFIEWLGLISIEGEFDVNQREDNFLTSYEVPEPNTEVGQLKFIQWRGFFTATAIENFWMLLKKFQSANLPWAAMYVQGFSDSPIAWGLKEHHYYTNGDNAYVLTSLLKDNSLIFTQKCSEKQYRKKSR